MVKKKITGASKGITGTAIRALEAGQKLKKKELRALKSAMSKDQLEESTVKLLEEYWSKYPEKTVPKKAKKKAKAKPAAKVTTCRKEDCPGFGKPFAGKRWEAHKKSKAHQQAGKPEAKVTTCQKVGCPGFGKPFAGKRWETHKKSKAHQEAGKPKPKPKPKPKKVAPPKEPTAEELFSPTTCIYCGEQFQTWDAWVRHVSSKKFEKASKKGVALPEIVGEGAADRAELDYRALGMVEDLEEKIAKKEEAVAEAHAVHEAANLRLAYALEAFERAKKTRTGVDDVAAEKEVNKAIKHLQQVRKKESSARTTLERLRGELSDLIEHRDWLKGDPLG